ncbi:hypothetical protein FKW77_006640 [Venturia effusa]|uniref:Rhodopsin domain-containing protein n=1 Tax=Venturia effusa TaxID=50376 RepID=A0A517LB03_9PEZI|nr:hypothetical protein FKW77_006640 [Venturia effusa]
MATVNPNIILAANLNTTFTAYQIPLGVIATWPPPDYEHPERRFGVGPFAFFMQVLTTVVVAGRIWARITRRAGTFGGDDALVIMAWIFGTAFTVISIYGLVHAGFDRHVWDIPQALHPQAALIAWGAEGLFLTSTCLTKISILLFYRRLVEQAFSKTRQRIIYGLIAFTIAQYFVFTFFLLFSCQPLNAAWLSLDFTYAVPYQCISRSLSDPMAGILSVVSDAYVFIIPELVVYRMNMQRRKKIVLFTLFGSGAIFLSVVGAGIARTVWLSRLYTDPRRDLSWIAYELIIWTTIEMQGNIICASAPAMKALISAYFLETKGDQPLEGLIGHIGTYDSKIDTNASDWPLRADPRDDMEKPMTMILERPIRIVQEEKPPPTPPKDHLPREEAKGWEKSSLGGITITERYSVSSSPDEIPYRTDRSQKGRQVLGF